MKLTLPKYTWEDLWSGDAESLLLVTSPTELFVSGDVEVDLQHRGRGLEIRGGTLTLTGGGTLTLTNGRATDAGGAVLIDQGELVLDRTTLVLEKAHAHYAGGLYMLAGTIRVNSAALRAVQCTADLAGAGVSIWDGRVQVHQGAIEVVECTTPWHAAGFVVFLGHVELDDGRIVATGCKSGHKGQSTSYGGGVVIGESFPGYMFGPRPTIGFRGDSRIEVTGCSSSAAVAVLFRRAVISSDGGGARVLATGNVMWSNTVPNLQPSYIVVFRRCRGDSIHVDSHGNVSGGHELLNRGFFAKGIAI